MIKYYIIAIISFLLGMLTYIVFPRDAVVKDPVSPPQDMEIFISNENGCQVYQEPYILGKDLKPMVKVVCK